MRAFYDLPAPAKLNLFLHVVGRRADGYHLLQSVFVPIDWADVLHIETNLSGQLRRHDLTEALPADDLVLRAARALQQATGCRHGADLHVAKHLPSGAGLGGGSSDAATTLLALNRLWGTGLKRRELAALALGLGADVPFFIGGRPAFVEGIGEVLTPLPAAACAPQGYAVVKPPASIPTAAIFGSPRLKRDTEAATVAGFLADALAAGGALSAYGRNDLQPPAEAHSPQVQAAAAWLQARFGNSRMTGSGSAVFARVPDVMQEAPDAGAGDQPVATKSEGSRSGLAAELPEGWVGRLCRSLPEHPLVHWAD